MDNCIINSSTVALLKKENKIYIYDVEKMVVFNKKINNLLENICLLYGSNLEGRKKFAKKLLNIKYKVPIIIDKNIILIPIHNLRCKECLLLVGNKILNYEVVNDKLKITCLNNEFYVDISKYSFEKSLLNYLKLINKLNIKNNIKFL